jgi:hypothetical protein
MASIRIQVLNRRYPRNKFGSGTVSSCVSAGTLLQRIQRDDMKHIIIIVCILISIAHATRPVRLDDITVTDGLVTIR